MSMIVSSLTVELYGASRHSASIAGKPVAQVTNSKISTHSRHSKPSRFVNTDYCVKNEVAGNATYHPNRSFSRASYLQILESCHHRMPKRQKAAWLNMKHVAPIIAAKIKRGNACVQTLAGFVARHQKAPVTSILFSQIVKACNYSALATKKFMTYKPGSCNYINYKQAADYKARMPELYTAIVHNTLNRYITGVEGELHYNPVNNNLYFFPGSTYRRLNTDDVVNNYRAHNIMSLFNFKKISHHCEEQSLIKQDFVTVKATG
jgi:hypothetical protein